MEAVAFKAKSGAIIVNLCLSNVQYLWMIAMGGDEKVINLGGVSNS